MPSLKIKQHECIFFVFVFIELLKLIKNITFSYWFNKWSEFSNIILVWLMNIIIFKGSKSMFGNTVQNHVPLIFLKKIINFFMFSDYFDVLISKIIFNIYIYILF